ncbi:unnamed protein product [Urochloa decumbens]|uniref:Uncharacterized protein n=1 Tax=Urochloa decumbens TaxID=240449 RepID=A0ABC8YE09_9POAL
MEGRALYSASHEFRVDYEQAKHLAVGAAIHSDAFSAGGHMWRVNLYPRGINESDNGQYVSVYFELLNRTMTRSVSAIFEAFFIDEGGQPSSTTPKRSNIHVFQMSGGGAWGWSQFISVPHLEENNVKDRHIWLVCAIMVVNDSSIPMPPSDLGDHLGALLDSADGIDVSFVIGGQTFHAHRAVLAARSPVFRAELLGSMAESTMSSITLQDIAPETFKLMLQFVYTDAFPEDHELGDPAMRIKTLMLLLAAADRYALGRLKLLCAKRLWDNMTLTSVAGTLAFADKHNCPELKEKCLDFIVTSGTRVFLTDGYIGLELRQKIGGMMQSPNGPHV